MSAPKIRDQSDKVFWHGYVDFYERHFANRSFPTIAEIGILRGNSIRWLLERFPTSEVHGADILHPQPEWPTDARFKFSQVDQADRMQVRRFFSSAAFDLVIEDGSHVPEHQAGCLVEGVKALRPGGLYIVEDIHTSHPSYSRKWWAPKRAKGTALSVLLGIQHYKKIGVEVDWQLAHAIADRSMLSADDVLDLANSVESLELYRRVSLPNSCFRCGSSDYLFSSYRCICGVDVFSDTDSMSFAVNKKSEAPT